MPGPTEEPKSSFEKTKSNSFETGHQRGEISANMEEGEIDAVEKPRPWGFIARRDKSYETMNKTS
jgi:hypothetical protein